MVIVIPDELVMINIIRLIIIPFTKGLIWINYFTMIVNKL